VHERVYGDSGLLSRCRSIQLALPETAVFTHLTAAALHRLWLPQLSDAWSPATASLIASVPTSPLRPVTHQERRGVYVRRCAVAHRHRQSVSGVRVASAAWTLVELAEDLALVDLVAAMDSALNRKLCTLTELESAAVAGRRGVRTFRRAVSLADGRSESAWESVLRLLHVLCGITDVEPQHESRTAEGELLARGDLWLRGSRRWVEYDGGAHRDASTHAKDLRRDKWLARMGWERYGYIAAEIHNEPQTIVRDAESALGMPHDPSRLDGWLAEYRLCSLSSPGASALGRRLARFERPTARRRSRGRGPSSMPGAGPEILGPLRLREVRA
jgi:hypothetical protein